MWSRLHALDSQWAPGYTRQTPNGLPATHARLPMGSRQHTLDSQWVPGYTRQTHIGLPAARARLPIGSQLHAQDSQWDPCYKCRCYAPNWLPATSAVFSMYSQLHALESFLQVLGSKMQFKTFDIHQVDFIN